ncbi:MAG: fumarylacetoacetate hydrolase family protein [candidate division Zixibacteria bacterium]|nr:fumarylacetoacetate hydrolase family protein [candidate division Zixibacteria bacterium]MCK4607742.1 fumarylacetoacetate hydrolase family protein [candidate division Zixibacteria bacterium]
MINRYVFFHDEESAAAGYGLLEDDAVAELQSAPWYSTELTGRKFSRRQIVLHAPVEPTKIVCIGLNYHAHVKASQSADEAPEYPLIFLKPSSAVIGPGEKIVHPRQSERVDYEAELGVIIGREVRNVSIEEASRYIFGLTCVNDVTARDLQRKDGQWSRAKGFDTFCPTGPCVVTGVDYSDLLVEGLLNGEVKQSGRTSLMIFDIPYLVSYVSSVMTLHTGDLISTGTPSGIGPMKPGDEVEVRIEHVGSLVNPVAGHN